MTTFATSSTAVRLLSVVPLSPTSTSVRFQVTAAGPTKNMIRLQAGTGEDCKTDVPITVLRDMEDQQGVRTIDVSVRLPDGLYNCVLSTHLLTPARATRVAYYLLEPDETIGGRKRWDSEHADAISTSCYPAWLEEHRTTHEELARERKAEADLPCRPLISIVTPVFRTPPAYLRAMIDSVLAQTYSNWELVIANASGDCPDVDEVLASYDDPRLHILVIENRSISENTNEAITQTRGDYVGFVDHDDLLEPDCLYRYVETIEADPQADLLFCDEDLVRESDPDKDEGVHVDSQDGLVHFCPKFKPGWNLDLMQTHNYVCHLLMVSRHALDLTERSDKDVTAAQDYDLAFKAAEVSRDIACIPRMLYHWRDHPASIATNRDSKPYAFEAGRLAIQHHLDRGDVRGTVGEGSFPLSYRVRYGETSEQATVICHGRHARATADGIIASEVSDQAHMTCVDSLDDVDGAIRDASTHIVVLVSDTCTSFSEGWLQELVRTLAARSDLGLVAPELLAEDGLVLSHGLTFCPDGGLTSAEHGFPQEATGYMSFLRHARDVSAVAGAVVALRRADYVDHDGFCQDLPDELRIPDWCLTLAERGPLVMVEPYAPVTVRLDQDGDAPYASPETDGSSRAMLLGRHPRMAQGDPWLDPAIDPTSTFFGLRD